MPAVAIVLDLPASTVHERNLARAGRVVPPEAVDAQLADLAAALRPGGLDAEGFAATADRLDQCAQRPVRAVDRPAGRPARSGFVLAVGSTRRAAAVDVERMHWSATCAATFRASVARAQLA